MALYIKAALSVFLVLVSCLIVPSLAAIHTVGGSNGWAMGVDYNTWASGMTFSVGDTLVFNYPGGHTVDEVIASDYKTCTVGNSITTDSSGTTAITLTAPGTRYFICGVMGHCGIGMKLAVNVAAAGVSASQPPLVSSSALPPAFGLGLPPSISEQQVLPPLGSGTALPPTFGLRSLTPAIAGSRNVNSESLEPTSSSASTPDFSAGNAVVGSAFWSMMTACASMAVFGLF